MYQNLALERILSIWQRITVETKLQSNTLRLYDKDTKNVDTSDPLKSYFPTTDDNGFGVTRFYSTDIYDSTFNIGFNKDNKNTIAIQTDKNLIFNLDSPKTKLKNVTVD